MSKLDEHPPNVAEPMPCYRVMEEDGAIRPDADPATADVDKETALRMYKTMVRLQRMDAGESRLQAVLP